MIHIALIHPGPNWKPGTVYDQGAPIADHLVAMGRRFDEGSLLLGGPFDRDGGIAVLDVDDRAAARALMDADPAVVAGVLVYEVYALTAYYDAFHGVRRDRPIARREVLAERR